MTRYQLVALRKESVDRNPLDDIADGGPIVVALRKESVDRNTNFRPAGLFDLVALRKESVDRNLAWHCIREDVSYSRSPQGERG